MSMLKRVKTMVTGSINDILDKLEDPETAVNQMVRDIEQAISEMRTNTASAMGTVTMTEKKLKQTIHEQKLWQENAETAIKSGDEELAKKAIIKRKAVDETVKILENQLVDAKAISEKMKTELKYLEIKLNEAKIKKDSLVSKKRVSDTKKKLFESAQNLKNKMEDLASAGSQFEGFEGFGRFEEKIEKQMAEVEAREELTGDSLEREFQKMKRDKELEEELNALKAKVGQ